MSDDLEEDGMKAELQTYLKALATREEKRSASLANDIKPRFLWVAFAAEWSVFLRRSFVVLLVAGAIPALLPLGGGAAFISLVVAGFVALASILAIE